MVHRARKFETSSPLVETTVQAAHIHCVYQFNSIYRIYFENMRTIQQRNRDDTNQKYDASSSSSSLLSVPMCAAVAIWHNRYYVIHRALWNDITMH